VTIVSCGEKHLADRVAWLAARIPDRRSRYSDVALLVSAKPKRSRVNVREPRVTNQEL
jgi:hypothetical protein